MKGWYWRVAAISAVVGLAGCKQDASRLEVLDKPEATLNRRFQQVSNVVELTDGRIALAELKDKAFFFADFKTGDATPIGTHADTILPNDPGLGKHKLPGYVFHLMGDTVGLVDFATERTTLWNEQGQYLGRLMVGGVGGHNMAVNYDDKGNAYKEDIRSVLGGLEPGQEVGLDSLAVIRIPRGDTIADTVARLRLPPWGRGQFGMQVRIVSTIFAPRDIFGVLPDGSMWLARASNNAVDWRSPTGQFSRGPSRSYTKIPVEGQERDDFMRRLRLQMAHMGAPAGIELTYPFADQKAPFTTGLTNPAGQVWLERARAFGDSVPVWDVVGRDGKEIEAVQLPKAASLAGFGKDGKVYVILREAGGLESLARYALRMSGTGTASVAAVP